MRYLAAALLFLPLALTAQIGGGLNGQALIDYLEANYAGTLNDYDTARDFIYGQVDLDANNQIETIYTGLVITIDPNSSTLPRTQAFQQNPSVNTEHVWPDSRINAVGTFSDIHALRPALGSANSTRSNNAFADINDNVTDKWWLNGGFTTALPASGVRDTYSESTNSAFEPRESVKGEVARTMFYVRAVYDDAISASNKSWFDGMKATLRTWHQNDPVDSDEQARSSAIAAIQGEENPFIIDASLVDRAFFQSGGSDTTPPTVQSLQPADDGTDVGSLSNLVLTFDESVSAGTGNISLHRRSDNVAVDTIAIGSASVMFDTFTVTINPTVTLDSSTAYYVNISSSAIEDASGNAFAGIADTTTWNFTTSSGGISSDVLAETFHTSGNFTLLAGTFFTDGSNDYFGITNGTSILGTPTSGIDPYTGFSGNFLTAQDVNAQGGPDEVTLQWSNLPISGLTSLQFRGDFANSGGQAIDDPDFVRVEYAIDSGSWITLLDFQGDDIDAFNGRFRLDTDDDGLGDGTEVLGLAAQSFVADINMTGDSLDLRLRISLDAGAEDIGVDNFVITGVAPAETGIMEDLTAFEGETDSAGGSQSITLDATNLTGNLVVTAPQGYEIADDDQSFSNSLALPTTNGATQATLYIRLASGNPVGVVSGDLIFEDDTGIIDTLPITGSVSQSMSIIPEPAALAALLAIISWMIAARRNRLT